MKPCRIVRHVTLLIAGRDDAIGAALEILDRAMLDCRSAAHHRFLLYRETSLSRLQDLDRLTIAAKLSVTIFRHGMMQSC
jgi:hypothetical protein